MKVHCKNDCVLKSETSQSLDLGTKKPMLLYAASITKYSYTEIFSAGMHDPVGCVLLPTLFSLRLSLHLISMNTSTIWLYVGKEAHVGAPHTCLGRRDKSVRIAAT